MLFRSAKDSKKDINLLDSAEYEDFKLFLEIAKELGIEAKIILFPVNGKWYDHIGINKESRKKYYEKIKAIAKEYGASQLPDFSYSSQSSTGLNLLAITLYFQDRIG